MVEQRITVRCYAPELRNLELVSTAMAEFLPGHRRPTQSTVLRTGLAVLEILAQRGKLGDFLCGNGDE